MFKTTGTQNKSKSIWSEPRPKINKLKDPIFFLLQISPIFSIVLLLVSIYIKLGLFTTDMHDNGALCFREAVKKNWYF